MVSRRSVLFGLVAAGVFLASGNARSGTDKNVTISLELNREDHIIGEFVPPRATLTIVNNGEKAVSGYLLNATQVEVGTRKSHAAIGTRQELRLIAGMKVAAGKNQKLEIDLNQMYRAHMRTECKLHVSFSFKSLKGGVIATSPPKILEILRLRPTHSQVATYVFKASPTDSYAQQFSVYAAKVGGKEQVFYKDAGGLRRMGKAFEPCSLQMGIATSAEAADKKEVRLIWRTSKTKYRYLRIPDGLLNSREVPGRYKVYSYFESTVTNKSVEVPLLTEKGKLHLIGKMTKSEATQRSDDATERTVEEFQAGKKKTEETSRKGS